MSAAEAVRLLRMSAVLGERARAEPDPEHRMALVVLGALLVERLRREVET